MSAEVRAYLEWLEARVSSLERGENVAFLKNIERRAGSGIKAGTETAATSIDTTVRNSAGTGTEIVAKRFDNKRQIILQDGTVEYIGTYNS